jgi:DinB superfamily
VADALSQVDGLLGELAETRRRAETIFSGRTAEQVLRRPAEKRWSAAECVEHLNITNRAYLPRISEALGKLRQKSLANKERLNKGRLNEGTFRLDWNARLLKYWLEPPSRLRLPTGAAFQPIQVQDPAGVLSSFQALNLELEEKLADGRGLALDAEKIRSPFAENMQYSVYSAFVLIAAHNRRHLWQAENALKS